MVAITRFEEIEAWQLAPKLVNLIYVFSDQGSFAKDFSLQDQIRRAAVSVVCNIAKRFESQTQALFINYRLRAKASAGEVRTQLYILLDRNYISHEQFESVYQLVMETSRKIYRFVLYLESHPSTHRIRENITEYNIQL